ncbi:hypothetical protein ACRALDRAFT_206595 [Sodiomyces alcalophilus JCM 7366]|uniref:uncharacterized protein n=1 Tax=Sodiomyces alcalophilus JCM 7366 TaxID=591952 RepID=UPI0039B5F8C4
MYLHPFWWLLGKANRPGSQARASGSAIACFLPQAMLKLDMKRFSRTGSKGYRCWSRSRPTESSDTDRDIRGGLDPVVDERK